VNGKVVVCALAFCAACSSSTETSGHTKAGSTRPADAAPPTLIFGTGNTQERADASCVAEVRRAEALPLDIYVLFDQSGSMSTPSGAGSRLDAVRAAASDFLNADDSAGIGVGLGYFGNFPIGQTSCNSADYATPAVDIGLLPGQTGALLTSLDGVKPTGETPTGPAIRGACSYVADWDKAHPGRSAALLLLTDGVPEAPISRAQGCDPTLADAVAAATECVTTTGASIYVLGVGPSLDNLNQIAAAGGSGAAYLVDGGDVAAQVLDALDAIRGTALPCGFVIPGAPTGQTLDYAQVNVVQTNDDGTRHPLYNVADATACDAASGGWFYEPANAPERITLCDTSCRAVKAESRNGAIEFALGCQTVTTTR
jgi:Mg-chelatase subunit ChlD